MTKQLPMNQMLQVMFTEEEWDAIYNAMADYQDHGEQETDLAVQSRSLHCLTNWCDGLRTI